MARSLKTVDLQNSIIPLTDARATDELLDMIGSAPVVLLGEASHGTHEFYHARAELTKRLIAEKGFTAICIEGDWPDAYRVNRFVRGAPGDRDAAESLAGFTRFPAWMWRNADVLDFIGWLREYNDASVTTNRTKVGFYGLDLYSMYASIDAVVGYLEHLDPEAAQRARNFYACLDPYAAHPETYGMAAFQGLNRSCRGEVLRTLLELQHNAHRYARADGRIAEDQYFFAEQNARVVASAERYYRAMIDNSVNTWNLRDAHMVDTMNRLMTHLSRHQTSVKAIVWAHNSHVGNARATDMQLRGETNIGSIVRHQYGDDSFSVGFTTYTGTVTAASDWHAPAEHRRVIPARQDSYEYLFHSLGSSRFLLPLRTHRPSLLGLPNRARERAIGVVYRPQTELQSHYFSTDLINQFDAVLHFDRTRAVVPLEAGTAWKEGEVPETYPTGD